MTDSNTKLTPEALLNLLSESSDSSKKNKVEPGTSYEVFRNNTTAVEVIVKELPKLKRKLSVDDINLNVQNLKIRSLEDTNEILVNELSKSNQKLVHTTNRFKVILAEMKKQIETAHVAEIDAQEKCLSLQFENEKLKALLNSKTSLVMKFKRELSSLKKVMKFVVKSISLVPDGSQVSFISDADYEVFEKDLKKDGHVTFLGSFNDGTVTFNSTTLSKDTKDSIEKRS